MTWPHRVHMAIPAALLDAANAVARPLDPDSGGDRTFAVPLSPTGAAPATHYGASTAARPEFVQTIQAILAGQVPLHPLVASAYAERWPDLAPPSAEECEQVRIALEVEIDTEWREFLGRQGIKVFSGDL